MALNTPHKQYAKMAQVWKRCRDVVAGEDAVHTAGPTYLPQLKEQTSDSYAAYVKRASFYNATWRTISGLLGMMFRKPALVEVPETTVELLKNVDLTGQPIHLFLQDVSENCLILGRVGVLVDYPQANLGLTQADAAQQNLRPTLQLYTSEAILNWREETFNNQKTLVQCVLKECKTVVITEFDAVEEDRWRVLDLVDNKYRQRVFKLKGNQANLIMQEFEQEGSDIYPTMQGVPISYIPFVCMGTDDVGFDVDNPPLVDLVNVNLTHYRTEADHAHGCHFTALPTLFLAGFTQDDPNAKIYIGGESAIITSNESAHATFVEFSGAGLGALEKRLARLEQQMAVLGARMLEPRVRGVESADTASIHRKGEESMLAAAAYSISLGMTVALKWFVEWEGLDSKDVKIEINRDFYPAPMDPAKLSALIAGWQQGVPGLSDQGLFALLKSGGIVADDVTLDEEQARITERQQQYQTALPLQLNTNAPVQT